MSVSKGCVLQATFGDLQEMDEAEEEEESRTRRRQKRNIYIVCA